MLKRHFKVVTGHTFSRETFVLTNRIPKLKLACRVRVSVVRTPPTTGLILITFVAAGLSGINFGYGASFAEPEVPYSL